MNEIVLYLLIGLLGFCWCFQIFYHLYFLLRTSGKLPATTDKRLPLSLIICAKNEAHNLENVIPLFCSQDYPDFEVIVVNDCSSDDTELTLARLKTQYKNLYYTNIPLSQQHFKGKKLALTLGIKAAKNEHLVFSDADCRPTSDQWLKSISAGFSDGHEIVIGHGRFEKKKTLFNLFLRYETFYNAVQYMGFALRGKPFMAVGRNMAYTKSLFEKSDVFKGTLNIASGDDDLFIRRCANNKNTNVCLHYDSQTISVAPRNFGDWLSRKRRHLSTAPYYKAGIKSWLAGEALTRQIFWLLTLCSLFFPTFAPTTVGLFIARLVLVHIVLGRAANKLGEGKLHWATLLFDLFTPMIVGCVWFINIVSAKEKKWK